MYNNRSLAGNITVRSWINNFLHRTEKQRRKIRQYSPASVFPYTSSHFLYDFLLRFHAVALLRGRGEWASDANWDNSEKYKGSNDYLCLGRRCWAVELCWRWFWLVLLHHVLAVVSALPQSFVGPVYSVYFSFAMPKQHKKRTTNIQIYRRKR